MSFTVSNNHQLVISSTVALESAVAQSVGALGQQIDETIPQSSTNLALTFTCDVSAVKSFMLVVDGACTIKTNSSSAPDQTLTFTKAGAYAWDDGSCAAFLLTTDVTALYITSTPANRVRIVYSYDATP